MNSGYKDYSKIVNVLSDSAAAILNNSAAAVLNKRDEGAGIALKFVVGFIDGIIEANCDGPVVVDRIVTNGQQLAQWTAQGPHSERKFYPGIDSAWGCGSNSKYYATWRVERINGPSPNPNSNSNPNPHVHVSRPTKPKPGRTVEH